jgi:hypothetical protein
MVKALGVVLASMALFELGSAYSPLPLSVNRALITPAVRLSSTRKSALSMKAESFDRRSALLSLFFIGAGTLIGPDSARAAGAALSTKEAEEYARLLEEVCVTTNWNFLCNPN